MLFGRLRVPFERLAAEPRERPRSAHRAAHGSVGSAGARGDSPRRPISLVPPPTETRDDDFAGLDRLDREELDE
jgi:hypothetical protein